MLECVLICSWLRDGCNLGRLFDFDLGSRCKIKSNNTTNNHNNEVDTFLSTRINFNKLPAETVLQNQIQSLT